MLTLLLFAALGLGLSLGSPASAAVTQIDEGALVWGVKESWRNYTGGGTVSGGASINGNGRFTFPIASGSFDDATNTTTVTFAGQVRFTSWLGLITPGQYALDTTYKNLTLTIGPTEQVLRGTHVGYLQGDPGGELHEDDDVVLAKLDVTDATTSFAGGSSSWSEIAAVAGPGLRIYGEGTIVDRVSLAYSGPGGLPDLGEHWDVPGDIALSTDGRWVSDRPAASAFDRAARQLYVPDSGDVVHVVELSDGNLPTAKLTIGAHDADSLEAVGTPVTVTYPVADRGQYFRIGFDPASGSIFYVTGRDGASGLETTVRRATWNPATTTYRSEVVGRLQDSAANVVSAVKWNPVKSELAVIAAALAPELPYHQEDLYRFRHESGAWQSSRSPLVLPATGDYAGATSVLSPFRGGDTFDDIKALGVARDGSYVQAPAASYANTAAELRYLPALRVSVDELGAAAVSYIDGTVLGPSGFGTHYGYAAVATAADGSLVLHHTAQMTDSYIRVDVVDDQVETVSEIVEAPLDLYPPYEYSNFGASVAADPGRGWEWVTDLYDPDGFTLNAMQDDQIVSRHTYPEIMPATAGYPLLGVAPDGSVYLPIRDEATGRYGYQRLGYKGLLAELATQPQSAAVELAAGVEGETVAFTSTVTDGAPAPARQWQVKAPGESAFADVEGETATTLSVEARPGMDGSQYRAVYASDAGRIVSDVATLDVDYAPRISADVANRSVTEGADAVFVVVADGNPEPDVTWQRRADGFWQTVAPDDENFTINGPALTVKDTNTDQSGALFRAKLANSVGTVDSRTARLTVHPATSIPADGLELENVSLDWTGNEELQRAQPFGGSSFFSAGVSDGGEATYRASGGNAAVFQLSALGTESAASWATRAAHVSNGGGQLVRLYGGKAAIEPDGSAIVEWDAAFSVNFYGGLVPFTFADPELAIDADGTGTLTADMSGYASSIANPNEREPIAPVADVTVATFSGVEIDPTGEVAIAPDYAGVEVSVPPAATPQNRSAAGWGAWPQSFVDFHVQTGLSSYWYSSAGAFDQYKPADPFTVDFSGAARPADPLPVGPMPDVRPQPQPDPLPQAKPKGKRAKVAVAGRAQTVNGKRLARLATLSCPKGGTTCKVSAPKRVRVRIAGNRYTLAVLAPKALAAGKRAMLRVRLPKRAAARLAGRRATVKLKLAIVANGTRTVETVEVAIRAKAASGAG